MCFAPQRRALLRHLNCLVCFVHFDFEMCFAPQRRALFRHLNCQKWSGPAVLCTFWLQNVLRATTACTFSTSQLPKVLRAPGVFYILTWKCASRHNGVQFFICPLASWVRTRRFSEPTFRPSRATNHRKNTVFRDFPTFSRISIFFLLTLSLLLFSLLIFLFSLLLPYSVFHLSILSEVWLLNFLRWDMIYMRYDYISLPWYVPNLTSGNPFPETEGELDNFQLVTKKTHSLELQGPKKRWGECAGRTWPAVSWRTTP